MRKRRKITVRKLRVLIAEKPPKLDEETRRKTDHLIYVAEMKNLQNLAKKTGRKT